MSKLPKIEIKTTDYNAEWNMKEIYFQAIVATWISSYTCGVSIQHLTFNQSTPPQITSLMRFHIYFTITRFMTKFEVMSETEINRILREYNAAFLKDHYPKWTLQQLLHTEDPDRGVTPQDDYKWQNHPGRGSIGDIQNDYKKFIPKYSNGFTQQGLKLINKSIESYLYSILGAQAKAKQSIIGNKASAFEVQQIFTQIGEDSIINYNTSNWINNMNRSVSVTNILLNLAISPPLWLSSRNLIIIDKPITGYNNKLRIVTKDMKFGQNNINYEGVLNQP